MEKLLSIAVPTYNMEQYLSICLDSLLLDDEEYLDLLEVIVINDGSKDHSLEIANSYKDRFPNTFVIIDKPNGNYGSCINAAIRVAKGLYFRILDSDDFFENKSLLELLKFIRFAEQKPDMIITNFKQVYNSGKEILYKANNINYNHIYHQNEISIKGQEVCVMHGITYKLQVIKDSNLKHLEGISYTDSEYCFYPLTKVNTIIFLDICLYCYRIGRDGQTVSDDSYKKNIHSLFLIINRMLDYRINNTYDDIIFEQQKKILLNIISTYYRIILTCKFKHNEDLKYIDNKILNIDTNLYNDLNTFTYSKIPYIKLWRKFGLKSNSFIFKFFFKIIKTLK